MALSEEQLKESNRKRFAKAKKKREDFAKRLSEKYLDDKVHALTAQDIFDLAWEYGHASGLQEVEYFYSDFATLVKDALLRKGF